MTSNRSKDQDESLSDFTETEINSEELALLSTFWTAIKNFDSILRRRKDIVLRTIPAHELYELAEEILHILLFIVKEDHIRSRGSNRAILPVLEKAWVSGIRHETIGYREDGSPIFGHRQFRKPFLVPRVDSLSNIKMNSRGVQTPKLTAPDPAEIEAIEEIIVNLISLRRNRSLSRAFKQKRRTLSDKSLIKRVSRKRKRVLKKQVLSSGKRWYFD